MSFEDWQTAVIPKVPGTWNVHEATKDQKLDFFVLFSSASGTIGQSGQVNYASSNTFQDAFVQYRQSLGLAASVLDIGVVEDIGYVSENPQFLESLRSASFHLLSETDLLECLQLIMSRSFVTGPIGKPSRTEGYLNPAHLVLGLKTPLPLANPSNRSIWKRDPRMAAYRDSSELAPTQSSGTDEVLKRFLMTATLNLSSLTSDKSVKFLSEQIEQRVLGFLMTTEGGLDKTATLNDIGIDSLVAIELRNWWKQNLSSDISVLELLNASLDQLGRIAGERG
jgi:aryl carrier-like protein